MPKLKSETIPFWVKIVCTYIDLRLDLFSEMQNAKTHSKAINCIVTLRNCSVFGELKRGFFGSVAALVFQKSLHYLLSRFSRQNEKRLVEYNCHVLYHTRDSVKCLELVYSVDGIESTSGLKTCRQCIKGRQIAVYNSRIWWNGNMKATYSIEIGPTSLKI